MWRQLSGKNALGQSQTECNVHTASLGTGKRKSSWESVGIGNRKHPSLTSSLSPFYKLPKIQKLGEL